MREHLHLANATRELCVFPARRDFYLCLFKEISCIDFSWGWESFCFIFSFPSDTEITSFFYLCRQQENWKDWDIRSVKGQKLFYSKVGA